MRHVKFTLICSLLLYLLVYSANAQTPGTYYAYKDGGEWHNGSTWTTDPTGQTRVPATGAGVPTDGATVEIGSSTVYLASDVLTQNLTITIKGAATLDLRDKKFVDPLFQLSGTGTLIVGSSSFPKIVAYRPFLEENGGTVRFNVANAVGVNISDFSPTFWNLEFVGKATYAYRVQDDKPLRILKDLTIGAQATLLLGGIPSQPDGGGAAFSRKKISIKGSLSIAAGAALRTIDGSISQDVLGADELVNYENTSHILELEGNFTNLGTVQLHKVPKLDFARTTTNQHNVTLIASGVASTNFRCEGTTDLYNLVVKKGTDPTTELKVIATDRKFFRLYGQNISSCKALHLSSGTLRLQGKTAIASLCEKGGYILGKNSALVLDGAEVLVVQKAQNAKQVADIWGINEADVLGVNNVTEASNGANIELQGLLHIKNGTYAVGDGAVITSGNFTPGELRIDSGRLFAPQIYSGDARLAYKQNGGTVVMRGRRADVEVENYTKTTDASRTYSATFSATPNYKKGTGVISLQNNVDIFEVKGGELHLVGADEGKSGETALIDILATRDENFAADGKVFINLTGLTESPIFKLRIQPYIGDLDLQLNSDTQEVRLQDYELRIEGSFTLKKGLFNITEQIFSYSKDFTVEGGMLDATKGTLRLYAKGDRQFKIVAPGSIKDNTIKTLFFRKHDKDNAQRRSVSFSGFVSLTCQEFNTYNSTDVVLTDPNAQVVIKKLARMWAHFKGGKYVLDNGALYTGGYANIDDVLILPNAKVKAQGWFAVLKHLTLSQGAVLDIGNQKIQLQSGATIVTLGDNSGYIQTNGLYSDGGILKNFSPTQDVTGNFVIPFKHLMSGGQLLDRTMTITWSQYKSRSVAFSYVNGLHPMLREGLPYYARVIAEKDENSSLSGLTLSMPNKEASMPTDYKLLKLNNYQWYEIGMPTSTVFSFSLSTSGDYAVGRKYEIKTFISVQDGNWNVPTTWTPVGVPQKGDRVQVRHAVHVAPVPPQYNDNAIACGDLEIESAGVLDIPEMHLASIVRVRGSGKLRLCLDPTNDAHNRFQNDIDLQDFLTALPFGTTEFYMTQANAEVLLPYQIAVYGHLVCSYEKPNQVFVVSNKLESQMIVQGNVQLKNPTDLAGAKFSLGGIAKKYTAQCQVVVKGKLEAQNTTFHFTNSAQKHLVYLTKEVLFAGSAKCEFAGANEDDRCGYIYFYSGLDIQTNDPLAFATSKGYVATHFLASENASIKGNKPMLSRQCMLNTAQPTTVLTVENTGGISSSQTTPNNWFYVRRGILHLKSAFTFHISQDNSLDIAREAELRVDNDNTKVLICTNGVSSGNTALGLAGKLHIIKGIVEIGSPNQSSKFGDIRYDANSPACIEVHGGELKVYGRIRNAAGASLTYIQTGGKVTVTPIRKPEYTAGFDIAGSVFKMTGGELIYGGSGGNQTDGGDIRILSLNPEITGGTIRLTGGGTDKEVLVSSTSKFYNLSCEGNNQEVHLWGTPLEVSNELKISANSKLIAQDVDLTVGGAFQCDGKYEARGNQTIFTGTNQTISGNASQMTFNDVVVRSVNSLTYQVPLAAELNANLSIVSTGVLDLQSSVWKLKGNLLNNGGFKTQGTGVLQLIGTERSELRGNGDYGSIAVKKSAEVIAANDINLHGTLYLENGNFLLDRYLLHVFQGGKIDRGATNYYVVTAGSFVSQGIKQELRQGDQSVLFPLGLEDKYTPAILNIPAPGYTQNTGYVRVANISNSFGVVGDCRQKVLNYHWEVESQNQALTGEFEFSCPKTLMEANMVVTESAPMRFTSSADWVQQTRQNLSEDLEKLKIVWKYTAETPLDGRYTAGPPLCFMTIKEVESIATGNWADPIWKPYNIPSAPVIQLPDGPNGLTLHIRPNHEVTVNVNTAVAKAVVFEAPLNPSDKEGLLKIIPALSGIDLGEVSGRGGLEIAEGTLPTGDYSHFFGCANEGKLILAGSNDYALQTLLANEYPYLWLTGSGKRTMPNADITVCNELQMKGTAVYDNTVNNKGLRLLGTIERETGAAFHAGAGTGAWVWLKGTLLQELGGTGTDFQGTNAFNHLYIENEQGVKIREGGIVEVKGDLRLKKGKVTTPRASATTKLKVYLTQNNTTAADPEMQGHIHSYIDGPLWAEVASSVTAYRFPLGVEAILANQMMLTELTAGELCVEAAKNIETQKLPPLNYVDQYRSWKVSGTISTAKVVFLTAGFDWATTTPDADLRVVKQSTVAPIRWEGLDSEVSAGGVFGREVATTTVQTLQPLSYQEYSLGTKNGIVPTVNFADAGRKYCAPVNGTVPVPLHFSFSGNWEDWLPMLVTYKVDGITRTITVPVTANETDIFNLNANYSDAANLSDKFVQVQIVSLEYRHGLTTHGQGLHNNVPVKVNRMPNIDAGTYTMCFTNESSVLLNGTTSPDGAPTWSNTGLNGTFANKNSLTTLFTLTETGSGLQLKLKVDNDGCAAEKDAVLNEATAPAGTIAGRNVVCANNGVDVIESYIFTPANVGTYDYVWSLEDKPSIPTLDLVTGTQNQNPVKVNWSHVGVLPSDLEYKAKVHLKVTDANRCLSSFDYPVRVIIKLGTAPLYHLPYNQ